MSEVLWLLVGIAVGALIKPVQTAVEAIVDWIQSKI
jgi:hypothetical protein